MMDFAIKQDRQPAYTEYDSPGQEHQPHRYQRVTTDNSGRSLLHIAVLMSVKEVQMVLEAGVNVNLVDLESGWTALHKVCNILLHKCFFAGNLQIAVALLKRYPDLLIRDREGNTCIDLLYSSIKTNARSRKQRATTPAFENTAVKSDLESENIHESNNLEVSDRTGHSSSGPDRLDFTKNMKISATLATLDALDAQITQIAMSKYHMVILTTDCVFTHGFGSGGRLGHGSQDTILHPSPLKNIPDKCVAVAVGPDHTIFITAQGRVFSCGDNTYSTLGYTTAPNSLQLIPFEVSFKAIAIGAACSKYHSSCFTSSGSIYTWGTNNGQLGYSGIIQTHPRKITSFPQQDILKICATNCSTAVLTGDRQVYVFANSQLVRVILTQKFVFKPFLNIKKRHEHPIDIVSGNHQYAAIMTSGDCFLWSPPSSTEHNSSWQQQHFPQSKPKKVWNVKKKHLAAISIAIGIDSTIVIATSCGSVFVGKRNIKDSLYKFTKISRLSHITSVIASSSGSFGAIRTDFRPAPDKSLRSIKFKSISEEERCLYHYDLLIYIKNDEEGDNLIKITSHLALICVRSRVFHDIFVKDIPVNANLANYMKVIHPGDSLKIPAIHFKNLSKDAVNLFFSYLHTGRKPVLNFFEKPYEDFSKLCKLFDVQDIASKSCTDDFLKLHSKFCDVIIQCDENESLMCHSIILASRCPFFKPILREKSQWVLEKIESLRKVDLTDVCANVFQIVLDYLHGDSQLFSSTQFKCINDWDSFMLSVLYLANRLLLNDLVLICRFISTNWYSQFLVRTITIKNVIEILNTAINLKLDYLLQQSIDFTIWNLETFIENKVIISLDDDVILAIQNRIQELQLKRFPTLRGEYGYYSEIYKKSLSFVDQQEETIISNYNAINTETSSSPTLTAKVFCSTSQIPFSLQPLSPHNQKKTNSVIKAPLCKIHTSPQASLIKPKSLPQIDRERCFLPISSAMTNNLSSSAKNLKGKGFLEIAATCTIESPPISFSPIKKVSQRERKRLINTSSANSAILKLQPSPQLNITSSPIDSPLFYAESSHLLCDDLFQLDMDDSDTNKRATPDSTKKICNSVKSSSVSRWSSLENKPQPLKQILNESSEKVISTIEYSKPIKKLSQKERKRTLKSISPSLTSNADTLISSPTTSPWKPTAIKVELLEVLQQEALFKKTEMPSAKRSQKSLLTQTYYTY